MKCPVCKTECHGNPVCTECGFDDLSPVFLTKEDGEAWIQNVVISQRQVYWDSLDDFEIVDCKLIKYHGESATVVIPYGIECISEEAFDCNKHIREVYLPETVRNIGDYAFNCSSLAFVNLPNGIERIGEWAFSGTDIQAITIPATCKRIGESAFCSCHCLCSVTIMRGVEEIESEAFSWCSQLKTIMIPDTVNSIGAGAFSSGCSEMQIAIDPRNETYAAKNNTLIDKRMGRIVSGVLNNAIPSDPNICIIGEGAYQGCKRGEGVLVLPPNIKEIENHAFCASHITRVFIPRSVKKMGSSVLFLVDDCVVFAEAKKKPSQWKSDWCKARKFAIAWDQRWEIKYGRPEVILLDKDKYSASLISYSYHDDEEKQMKLLVRLTNQSDKQVRFIIDELFIDEDDSTVTHWGTVEPHSEVRCEYIFRDSEFGSIYLGESVEISFVITVKEDEDLHVLAKGDYVSLPGFNNSDKDAGAV